MIGSVYEHKPTLIRGFYVDSAMAKESEDRVAKLIQEFIGPNWHVGSIFTSDGKQWHIYLDEKHDYKVDFHTSFLIVRDYDKENADELVFTTYASLYKFYDSVPDSRFVDLDKFIEPSAKEGEAIKW
jgi:hypothetical protein